MTLIESEAHEVPADGTNFSSDCLRRNIVTTSINLSELLGKEFQIGEAVLLDTKLWPPCSYISSLNPDRDVLRHFAKSAGIGATVVTGGILRVGDTISIR